MRVLVLGGYGLIGGEIVRALIAEGHGVIGLGRNADLGRRLDPRVDWIAADIGALAKADDWTDRLVGVKAVVNAAGALQDGARDNLAAVHDVGVKACIEAAERAGVSVFIQISAPGARADASTAFMRAKARADATLRASSLDWIIFKPGLVIGRTAYGGSALLRMLAGFPLIAPLVHAQARLQTVAAADVARAVALALRGGASLKADYDLVETESRSLRETVALFRRWLGLRGRAAEIALPDWVGRVVALFADFAGALGWRSPLRSTALTVLSENVVGDPAPWTAASGMTMKDLDATLRDMPSTVQERVFARVQLVLPAAVMILAAFWIASGAVGALMREAAAAHLDGVVAPPVATGLVIAGSALDVIVGAGLLFRATAKPFAVLSLAVAGFYLAAASALAPHLWLDPLGALVKVAPVMGLSAVVALLMVER